MSRRADAEKKLVDRIAERTGQEIAAACREEIEAERPSPFPHRGHPSWSAALPWPASSNRRGKPTEFIAAAEPRI